VLRVLREKFHWQGYYIHAAKQRIEKTARMVDPKETLDIITSDPPDNRVLECAAAAASEFIVTEDRDLLRLRQHGPARVVKVADFLRLIQEEHDPSVP
jgi:predicted nucleic acid-binding protein